MLEQINNLQTGFLKNPANYFTKKVPSRYSSIIKILNHIWSSQEYWRGMIAQATDIDDRFDTEHLFQQKFWTELSEILKNWLT